MSDQNHCIHNPQWLLHWLAQRGLSVRAVQAMTGDASLRRYYRVHQTDGQTLLVMDACRDHASLEPFLTAGRELANGGLRVPNIVWRDTDQDLLLIEDLGQESMLDYLRALRDHAPLPTQPPDHNGLDGRLGQLYRQAIDVLPRLQALPTEHRPAFDRQMLSEEMNLFSRWFMQRELGRTLDRRWLNHWQILIDRLCDNALDQPQVWVHRDFHSRNLMYRARSQAPPALLDFQDAVCGPACYDLMSLLRDYYFPLSNLEYVELCNYFLSISTIYAHSSADEMTRWFDWTAAQRHLKVIGIFSRLKWRDGKSDYLTDIPQAIKYLREISDRYEEFDWLNRLLAAEPISVWLTNAGASEARKSE